MSVSETPTARGSPPSAEATARRRSTASAGQDLVLERYRLHRRLGSGAFGSVWMARDERLDRDVAVKVVPRERVVGGRFEREARAAARLSHPGIVTLYEAAVDDEGAYLVSELVSGATMAELLEADRLSDRDIAQVGVALCDALLHAHAEGVIHRDVKPSNILIPDRASSPAQLAKLTDFGVARVIGGDSLTRTGDVVGTAAYMAPEQAEGRQAGASADLYSLALVIYEALTGVNPLRAGAGVQRARRLGAHLPPLRRHRRDLPRELGRAIDQALRPRAKERGSIEELRRTLAGSLPRLEDAPGDLDEEPGELEASRPEVVVAERDPAGDELKVVDRQEVSLPARLLAAAGAALLGAWVGAVLLHGGLVAAGAVGGASALAVALLPGAGWLGLTVVGAAALAIQGQAGAAVLLAVGALLPVALLPTRPARWPLAAAAPALGAISLAGAWPALAARASSAWQRAVLGAVGWVWLALGTVLSGKPLYAGLPDAVPPVGAWSVSPSAAVHEVLGPLFSSGALTPALVWAAAAVALPAVLYQRDLMLRAGLAALWAAALLGSTVLLLSFGPGHPKIGVSSALLGVAGGMAVAMLWPSPNGGVPGGLRLRRRAPTRVA